jgi:hypothetical protein
MAGNGMWHSLRSKRVEKLTIMRYSKSALECARAADDCIKWLKLEGKDTIND